MSTVFSIYKATNKINGKIYIGFDSNWPSRLKQHQSSYKTKKSKFYNSIKKYGWENFDWVLIYQSKDGEHCLNVMEPYFIVENDSFGNGLNSTSGGEGVIGYKHSNERKNKISTSQLGRKMSNTTRSRMSESKKGNKHPNFNKQMSEEQKKKISNSLKGIVPWNKGKTGLQSSPNRTPVSINGILYPSKFDAMTKLNISLYKLNKLITNA